MSSDKTTPLIDHEEQTQLVQAKSEEKNNSCKNSLGLLCAFLACVFFFLVVAISKFAFTLYPFLTPMDLQMGRCIVVVYSSIQAAVMRKNIYKVPSETRKIVLVRIITNTIGLLCYLWGVELLTTSKVIVLYNLIPFFVGLFAWCFLRERLHYADGIAMVVSFIGVFLVAYFSEDEEHKDTQTLGVLVMLVTATFIGASMVAHRAAGSSIHYLTIPFYLGIF